MSSSSSLDSWSLVCCTTMWVMHNFSLAREIILSSTVSRERNRKMRTWCFRPTIGSEHMDNRAHARSKHLSLLPDAMSTGERLNIIVGIPIGIEENDRVRGCQIDAQSASPGTQEKYKRRRACSNTRSISPHKVHIALIINLTTVTLRPCMDIITAHIASIRSSPRTRAIVLINTLLTRLCRSGSVQSRE